MTRKRTSALMIAICALFLWTGVAQACNSGGQACSSNSDCCNNQCTYAGTCSYGPGVENGRGQAQLHWAVLFGQGHRRLELLQRTRRPTHWMSQRKGNGTLVDSSCAELE